MGPATLRRYPHGVPPWAEEDLLGFYVECHNVTDVEISLGCLRHLRKLIGAQRYKAAMLVVYRGMQWSRAYQICGLPIDEDNWGCIRRAMVLCAYNLEESIRHSNGREIWNSGPEVPDTRPYANSIRRIGRQKMAPTSLFTLDDQF